MTLLAKALCVGDHIDTDAIIPARFLITSDPSELGKNCMAGLEPDWVARVTPGRNLMVAGRNFGCGSSREHAPVAILGAGMNVVIAHSFARIFYRNAFNTGLIPIEVGDDFTKFSEGDEIEVDMDNGRLTNKTTGAVVDFPPLPETMRRILDAGGLVPFVRNRVGSC